MLHVQEVRLVCVPSWANCMDGKRFWKEIIFKSNHVSVNVTGKLK